MMAEQEVLLMRLLHGELPESQALGLRERIGREPALAKAYARLARTWEGLALPAPAPAPADFKVRVMARVGGRAEPLSWSLAPLWVRSAAAAALALGVMLGAGLGLRAHRHEATGGGSPGIFESYLVLVNDAAAPSAQSPPGGEAQQ